MPPHPLATYLQPVRRFIRQGLGYLPPALAEFVLFGLKMAWACLFGNLALRKSQTLLIRGATSPLGQAALNIAAYAGAEVIATTRKAER
ncbi:MAG: hypothetical protein AAGC58_10440, partial [Asticcacaulis sp.]